VNSSSSIPSPIYQCKNTFHLNAEEIYIKLKHRTTVVINNTVYTNILEAAYIHNKVSIVLIF
jgi:hypothetical protein